MKFKIFNGDGDSLIVEAETIKEIQVKAKKEVEKRGWTNYWSEEL